MFANSSLHGRDSVYGSAFDRIYLSMLLKGKNFRIGDIFEVRIRCADATLALNHVQYIHKCVDAAQIFRRRHRIYVHEHLGKSLRAKDLGLADETIKAVLLCWS